MQQFTTLDDLAPGALVLSVTSGGSFEFYFVVRAATAAEIAAASVSFTDGFYAVPLDPTTGSILLAGLGPGAGLQQLLSAAQVVAVYLPSSSVQDRLAAVYAVQEWV